MLSLQRVRLEFLSPCIYLTRKSENFVSLRYTATGSHIGSDHNGIPPTKRKAQWTAAGNFVIDEKTGLIQHWWKDWDKMQSQWFSDYCFT